MNDSIDKFFRSQSLDRVHIFIHPLLPRVEKIFTKDQSTLAKQSQNVLLSFISRSKDFPRLIEQRTVHFIYGTYEYKKHAFVSRELFEQMREKYEPLS